MRDYFSEMARLSRRKTNASRYVILSPERGHFAVFLPLPRKSSDTFRSRSQRAKGSGTDCLRDRISLRQDKYLRCTEEERVGRVGLTKLQGCG